ESGFVDALFYWFALYADCTQHPCNRKKEDSMPAQQRYDLLVIGAGAAGSTAATTAAGQGAHVALVERDKIGGTCLNYGCDPTKTLIHIAQMLYQAHHAQKYGLHIPEAL